MEGLGGGCTEGRLRAARQYGPVLEFALPDGASLHTHGSGKERESASYR